MTATHLGRLTDAEANVIEAAIEAAVQTVLTHYGLDPSRRGEYHVIGSLLHAFQREYEQARVFAACGSGDTRPPNFDLRKMDDG